MTLTKGEIALLRKDFQELKNAGLVQSFRKLQTIPEFKPGPYLLLHFLNSRHPRFRGLSKGARALLKQIHYNLCADICRVWDSGKRKRS